MNVPIHTDRDARIAALLAAGLSAAQIAVRLGLTRNTVIGALYRRGLSAKPCGEAAARFLRWRAARPGPLSSGLRMYAR
jgi:DNA-binding CsgD family transcriptional regulator